MFLTAKTEAVMSGYVSGMTLKEKTATSSVAALCAH